MNRHQRRYGKVPKNESDTRVKVYKELGAKLEVVLAPKSKDFAKPMTNRSCFVAPEQRDFGQFTNCPDYKQVGWWVKITIDYAKSTIPLQGPLGK